MKQSNTPWASNSRGTRIRSWCGKRLMRLIGWRIEGTMPQTPKAVLVGAPHTSMFDFVIVILGAMALALPLRIMIKRSLFFGPLGPVLRFFGGFPVNRKAPGGIVAECGKRFESQPRIMMAIAAEGSRSGVREWRTGFHRIARHANAPVLPIGMDYKHKRMVIGPLITATDDVDADLRAIQTFIARQATAKHPSRMSAPIKALKASGKNQGDIAPE